LTRRPPGRAESDDAGALSVRRLGDAERAVLERFERRARAEVLAHRGGAALVNALGEAVGSGPVTSVAWGALRGGEVVGVLRIRLHAAPSPTSADGAGTLGEVDLLWVEPEARRRHVATRLIERARAELGPKAHLEAPALPGDRAAKAFFESAGMRARLLIMAEPEPARTTPSASVPAKRRGRPELSVGGIAIVDGRILLIRRGHPPAEGSWSFPGGRVEAGEDVASALRREMAEETGLVVEPSVLLGWAELIGAASHHVVLDFLVEVRSGDARPGDDAAEVRWATLGELRSLPLAPGIERFVAEHHERLLAAGALDERSSAPGG
jgi:8-oxo-dGTP diphosphatase